jgi:hypothetical protein
MSKSTKRKDDKNKKLTDNPGYADALKEYKRIRKQIAPFVSDRTPAAFVAESRWYETEHLSSSVYNEHLVVGELGQSPIP